MARYLPIRTKKPQSAESLREAHAFEGIMNVARDSQADLPTRRWAEMPPDTLSDGGCESGVQRCAEPAPEALLEPQVGNDVLGWGEPDEITLVSIYDQTGLQTPERIPLVEVVEEPASGVRPLEEFADLDSALLFELELG